MISVFKIYTFTKVAEAKRASGISVLFFYYCLHYLKQVFEYYYKFTRIFLLEYTLTNMTQFKI